MVVGTSSQSGKSWTATAICRSLSRRGLRTAPFKAQNMSLNSHPAANGGELGRSQAAQAEACGVEPTTDMNPILLKPTSERGSQVVVNGKVWADLSAEAYYTHYEFLLEQVVAAYRRLAARFDYIVIEGAGSASEINLRSRDLVNLRLAVELGAPALLVADIERGGVFAAVTGTFALLEDDERPLLRSFLVNRFRGEPRLFTDGRAMLEQRAGRPCLGVLPYLEDIRLDAEDSLCLEERAEADEESSTVSPAPAAGELRVAVVALPHMSNFTDFSLFTGARYVERPSAETPDCIILPGSKNTLSDLRWLRSRGLDRWVLDSRRQGASVWGVCGGYQMLGRSISDPGAVESGGSEQGLGLLPIRTTLGPEKTTRVVEGRLAGEDIAFEAYEIHMGETEPAAGEEPFAWVEGRAEGFRRDGIVGTYLHGAFENPDVADALLGEAARRRGKPAPKPVARRSKQRDYDRMADCFEQHIDMARFEELYLA